MYDAMMAETVSITGHGGDQIEAYLARPLGPGPFGGVVVIHHMPGYDAETKEITRTFAVHGYLALCPNLYYREAPGAYWWCRFGQIATYPCVENVRAISLVDGS